MIMHVPLSLGHRSLFARVLRVLVKMLIMQYNRIVHDVDHDFRLNIFLFLLHNSKCSEQRMMRNNSTYIIILS